MKLEERKEKIDHLLAKERYDFNDLVDIMALLRLPGGCMWDAEQTHESIRDNMIEETYEVIEAIDNKDTALLQEELGDALLQVVFHARIEEEANSFDISDVVNDICVKLIHRHPHVFGSVVANTAEEMLANWEKIKVEEKQRETLTSRLEAVPPMLPALMRASKIAKKTEFWYGSLLEEEAYESVSEALKNLKAADPADRETFSGELLYATAVLCRKLSVSGEAALTKTIEKRIGEIRSAEALNVGTPLESMTEEERRALRARLDALEKGE